MSSRKGDGFFSSWLEALGILEAKERISLEISEMKERISFEISEVTDRISLDTSEVTDRISEIIERLRPAPGSEQRFGRLANVAFVGCACLGLVGGVLLLGNLLVTLSREAPISLPPISLSSIHLPSINLPSINLPSINLPQILLNLTNSSVATSPATSPTPTASPSPVYYVVANTSGQGVYMRASAVMTDRIKAWPDGTYMIQVGPDREGDGRTWKNVQAPDGKVGWIPAAFLSAAPAPSITPGPDATPKPNATPRQPTATSTVAPTATPPR